MSDVPLPILGIEEFPDHVELNTVDGTLIGLSMDEATRPLYDEIMRRCNAWPALLAEVERLRGGQ